MVRGGTRNDARGSVKASRPQSVPENISFVYDDETSITPWPMRDLLAPKGLTCHSIKAEADLPKACGSASLGLSSPWFSTSQPLLIRLSIRGCGKRR